MSLQHAYAGPPSIMLEWTAGSHSLAAAARHARSFASPQPIPFRTTCVVSHRVHDFLCLLGGTSFHQVFERPAERPTEVHDLRVEHLKVKRLCSSLPWPFG